MLCPEVWNFRAPESSFRAEKGTLNQNNCLDSIKNFYFTHLVSVVLPDTLRTPESLSELLTTDCEYYKISNLSVGELTNKNFINNFVKKGSFTAITINRRIDCDDCVCVTPSGLIVLSLTKESYQTLGLDGKISHFHQNTKGRYIVHVDLLKECFKPGKKNYERTKTCLNKLNFTFLVTWEPPNEAVCPSSVAKYFHNLNYEIKVCIPDFKMRTDYSVKVPNFDLENENEFVEWLGAFSVQGNLDIGSPDNYLTTYEVPEPWMEYGQVKFLQWKGFYTSEQLERFFEELLKFAKCDEKPWVSLYVQGFSDSPVNWGIQEHHYYVNGDNSYTIVLNNEKYLLCKQMCSQKCYNSRKEK